MSEQTAARAVRIRHLAELVADDVRDPVVPREPLVDEGVVGGEQIRDRPILADDVAEEELGFAHASTS